jgi:hypothetical protein
MDVPFQHNQRLFFPLKVQRSTPPPPQQEGNYRSLTRTPQQLEELTPYWSGQVAVGPYVTPEAIEDRALNTGKEFSEEL